MRPPAARFTARRAAVLAFHVVALGTLCVLVAAQFAMLITNLRAWLR